VLIRRGLKGTIEQSEKSPKLRGGLREKEGLWKCSADKQNLHKKETLFLLAELHEALKRMDPRELKNILIEK